MKTAERNIFVGEVNRVAHEGLVVAEKKEKQKAKELKAVEQADLLPAEEVLRRSLAELLKKKPRGKK